MSFFPEWLAAALGVAAAVALRALGGLFARGLQAARRYRIDPEVASWWIIAAVGIELIHSMIAVALGISLRDYVRLDTTRISGTALTLTSAAQAERDAATMRELTHGLMGPVAEQWIVIGAPLDRDNLADKLAMSGRAARFWPANAVVVRRAVFLALDDKAEEGRGLLARALRTFPHRLDATILILKQAHTADPDAIEPLLAMARAARFRSEK